MLKRFAPALSLAAMLVVAGTAQGQSSSLHANPDGLRDEAADRYGARDDGPRDNRPRLNPNIARHTLAYSRRPEPRAFSEHDLITIVVNESFRTDLDSELSVEKSSEYSGGINEFPRLTLADLLDLQLNPNTFDNGRVTLDTEFESEFEGEGEYARSERMTGEIQAEVIEVLPNGTLVLEARKTLINDEEEVVIVATGRCRVEDVSPENTIRSSELANLVIDKQHEGQLMESTEKGLISRVMDFIFGF